MSTSSPNSPLSLIKSSLQDVIETIKNNRPALVFAGVFAAYSILAMMKLFLTGLIVAGIVTLVYVLISGYMSSKTSSTDGNDGMDGLTSMGTQSIASIKTLVINLYNDVKSHLTNLI